jgi:ribonuclease-3
MSDSERRAKARDDLRTRLSGLVGPEPIPRFEEALTHASFANETGLPDNQRLEFLGDSVLGLCVSELLARAHESADEGKLTRMRSALASWARQVDLGACVALGRGATLGTEREQSNVLADTAEAMVAAVYEARGLEGARALVREIVGEGIANAETLAAPDPKSALQERVQAEGKAAPTYRVLEIHGAGAEQVFEVEVVVDGQAMARAHGRSKRIAERRAAALALGQMNGDAAP